MSKNYGPHAYELKIKHCISALSISRHLLPSLPWSDPLLSFFPHLVFPSHGEIQLLAVPLALWQLVTYIHVDGVRKCECVSAGVLIELGCLGERVKTKFFVLGHVCILHSIHGIYVKVLHGRKWGRTWKDSSSKLEQVRACSWAWLAVLCVAFWKRLGH